MSKANVKNSNKTLVIAGLISIVCLVLVVYNLFFSDSVYISRVTKIADNSNRFVIVTLKDKDSNSKVYNINDYIKQIYPSKILGVNKKLPSKKIKILQNEYTDTKLKINLYKDNILTGQMDVYKSNVLNSNKKANVIIVSQNVYYSVYDEEGLSKLLDI